MTLENTFEKDRRARIDYSVRWVDWLNGDQLFSSAWAIVDTLDGALVIDTPTNTTGTATIWISSGTVNSTYRVENSIITLAGRVDNRSILIEVVDL
jgi:hypothetical protein